MKRLLFLQTGVLLAVFLLSNPVSGQKRRFYFGISGGMDFVLHAPNTSPLVHPLLGLPDQGSAFTVEMHYQWKNRLGLGFLLRFINPPEAPQHAFSNAVEQAYPDDYTSIGRLTGLNYLGDFEMTNQGFLVVSYAFIQGKWIARPRLLAGVTSFAAVDGEVVLKQRNTNQKSILTLKKVAPGVNHFHERSAYGLGMTVERNIWRRWALMASADWTTFSSKPKYVQTIENQVDGSVQTETFNKRWPEHMFHLSVGVLLRL